MPPPPCAWQPTQLYALNSCFPSLTAAALFSYGVCTGAVGEPPPGCRSLTTTSCVVTAGGASRKLRCSRLQAGAAAHANSASAHATANRRCAVVRSAAMSVSRRRGGYARYAVLVEQPADFDPLRRQHPIDWRDQLWMGAAHADADVEGERHPGAIDLRRHRTNHER